MKKLTSLVMGLAGIGVLCGSVSALGDDLTFDAKEMKICNATPKNSKNDPGSTYGIQENWFIKGEYVMLCTKQDAGGPINATGVVGFSPISDAMIPDGLYEVKMDIGHENVKKACAGDPPPDNNGSFAYRLSLVDNKSGKLEFVPSSVSWITHFPQDPDNSGGTPFCGMVALDDFKAYGSDALEKAARVTIKLTGVKASNLSLQLWDKAFINYGTVGLKSFTLIPVKQ